MPGERSWLRALRTRLRQGREYCRECGEVSPLLTPGHMIPRSLGGRYSLRNLTILCPSCQRAQGANIWFWQVSLWTEGYRPREGGLGLPQYRGVPDLIVWAPNSRGRRKRPRVRPDKLCDAGCICTDCTRRRSERLFDLDGHSAADRRGAL